MDALTWQSMAEIEPSLRDFERAAHEAAVNGWQGWPAWVVEFREFRAAVMRAAEALDMTVDEAGRCAMIHLTRPKGGRPKKGEKPGKKISPVSVSPRAGRALAIKFPIWRLDFGFPRGRGRALDGRAIKPEAPQTVT